MCNPMLAVTAALSIASFAANKSAQNKVAKARAGATEAERIRQQGFDKRADAINETSRDRYVGFTGNQNDKATELADYFKGNAAGETPTAAPDVMPSAGASNITVQEDAKQQAKARGYGDQQDTALGNLRSFGDVLGGIGLKQARDAGEIGTINNFKRGSSNVLQYELANANNAGNGMKTLADIFGGAATVTGMGAGGGFGGFGGSAPMNIVPGAMASAPANLGGVAQMYGTGAGMGTPQFSSLY